MSAQYHNAHHVQYSVEVARFRFLEMRLELYNGWHNFEDFVMPLDSPLFKILISIVLAVYGLFEVWSGLRAIKNKRVEMRHPRRVYTGWAARISGSAFLGLGIVTITATMLYFSRGISEFVGHVIAILLIYLLSIGLAAGIAAELVDRRQR